MRNILENIKLIREKKNLSQENIANDLGIAQNAYGLIENGKRKLTYERLEQIAIIFDCSVIDIITYPKKYVDSDTIEKPERISITFEISPDKRDVLLNLVTNKDN
jgi:transcriptional regulator with XRE-family HTH domain